ncbi:MAG: hypothetical protein JWP63_3615 [Candidatus Solibacter sp.]|nr:hypothetical protein [Candidatus Solibacter sp.]
MPWRPRGKVTSLWGGMGARRAPFCWARGSRVEVNHNWVLAAAHHDGLAGLAGRSVNLLVRHVRRNVDEITGPGLTAEFKVVTPPHADATGNDVEDGFQLSVVVGTGSYRLAGLRPCRPTVCLHPFERD